MPFPAQFLQSLFRLSWFSVKTLPEPFTESWIESWLTISEEVCEGSKKNCCTFFAGDGLHALQDLAAVGCDPDLVMSLFSRYLWDKTIPEQEQFDSNVKAHQANLTAVQATRHLFRLHTWEESAETKLVAKALDGLETIVQGYLDELDFTTGGVLRPDSRRTMPR